jgi:hypothetical protein
MILQKFAKTMQRYSGRIIEPNTYRRIQIIDFSKIRHENGNIFKNGLSKKGLEYF